MEKSLEEVYLEVESEGLFDVNLTLYLLDLPNDNILKSIPIKPMKNELFVFARGYNDNLKVGSFFDVIFPTKKPDEYIENLIELKYIYVNPKYESKYLPKGYSGICLLRFKDEISSVMLDKLASYDEKKEEKHDILILTQKEGLKKLLKKIEA